MLFFDLPIPDLPVINTVIELLNPFSTAVSNDSQICSTHLN